MSFYLTHHTFSSAKLIATSVSATLHLPTQAQCASLLVSYRLPFLIARPRPNADVRKLMKIKV
jgi:hypothetical protein